MELNALLVRPLLNYQIDAGRCNTEGIDEEDGERGELLAVTPHRISPHRPPLTDTGENTVFFFFFPLIIKLSSLKEATSSYKQV